MSERPPLRDEERSTHAPSANDGWAAFSTLFAGILLWGGIGWLADFLLGFSAVFLPVGLLLGFAGGIILIYVKALRSL